MRSTIEGGAVQLPWVSHKVDPQTDSMIAGLKIQSVGKRRERAAAVSEEVGSASNVAHALP
jgi:hypothetical protein